MMPVEGFFAHAVAGEKQPLAARVPESNSEHAVEPVACFIAPFFIGMHNDFSVTTGGEVMPSPQECSPQLSEVIDFTVEGYNNGPVFICHRLLATRELDDRETPHSHSDIVY